MTPKPVRLQRSRAKGARLVSPNGLPVKCVTRPGKFGNPYATAQEFSDHLQFAEWVNLKRDASFPYCGDAKALNHMKRIATDLGELHGCNLACFCKLCPAHKATGKPLDEECPDCKPCHCDPLGRAVLRLEPSHA